jgi:hypothetical protein
LLKVRIKTVSLDIAQAMNKTRNKARYTNAGIVMLLLVFLVFGFCPLRNVLSGLLRQVPQTTAPKAPEYAKIIAHDDCKVVIVAQPVPPLLVAWLPETDQVISLRFLIITDGYQLRSLTAPAIPARIYLRNRCLLI